MNHRSALILSLALAGCASPAVPDHVLGGYRSLAAKDAESLDAAYAKASAAAGDRACDRLALGTLALQAAESEREPGRRARWYGEAEARLREACSLDAGSGPAAFNLALCLFRLEKPADAVPFSERAAALLPGDAEARRLCARCLLGADDPTTALAFMERDPTGRGAEDWDLVGELRFRVGEPAAAATAFRRSIALTGGRPETWHNLGQALRMAGDAAEAERCLERSRGRER